MGTSGAYGGSGRRDWKKARQLLLDFPQSANGSGTDGAQPPNEDEMIDSLWGTIADALVGEDPSLDNPSVDEELISLDHFVPHLRVRSSQRSGGAGGAVQGARRPVGRSGTGSRRQVARSAARGGTALGAAYAVRRGEAGPLEELGLSLDDLRGLSPVRQCAAILDAVLGEGGHPDEFALRKASLESLKQILQSESPPEEIDAVRGFVVNFVFELMLVELQAELDAGTVDATESAQREKKMRRYLERRVGQVRLNASGQVKPSELRAIAARLAGEVIRVLRARSETA